MRFVRSACLIVAAAGLPASALAQGPFTQSQTIDPGLIAIPGTNRADIPAFVTNAGDVFGFTTTDVSINDNDLTAIAAWRANATGADLITLSGPQYSDPTTGAFLNSVLSVNDSGQAVGIQFSGTGDTPGYFNRQASWFFDGTNLRQIGLRAADIGSATPFSEENLVDALSDTGVSIGRYISTVPPPSDSLPFGAIINIGWVSRNGVTTPLGLTGGEFIRPFVNQPSGGVTAVNNRGQVAGYSDTFRDSAEIDSRVAWRYDLETQTYVTMGLRGPDYANPAGEGLSRSNIATMLADDGTVAGIANVAPEAIATGTWVFRNGVTTEVGLRGPRFGTPGYASSEILKLTNNGIAYGTTIIDQGDSVDGSAVWAAIEGVTRRVGPTTAEFVSAQGDERSNFADANDSGLVAGSSQSFNPATLTTSRLAWVQNAARTAQPARVLALTDALHTGPTGQRASIALDVNNEGFVVGQSFQFGATRLPNGGIPASSNTPWLYNSNTDTFTAVPLPATASGRSSGFVINLTPRGGVVGFFLTGVGRDREEFYRPFYWSANAGFVDLAPTGPLYTSPWDTNFPIAVSPDGARIVIGATLLTGDISLLRVNTNEIAGCDDIDFNNNTVFPEDQDVIDFFNVLAGGDCSAGNTCNDIDFNNNTVFPEDQDVISFFTVLAGGSC